MDTSATPAPLPPFTPTHLDLCRWQSEKVYGTVVACGTAFGVPWEVRRRERTPLSGRRGAQMAYRVTVLVRADAPSVEGYAGGYCLGCTPMESECFVEHGGATWAMLGVFVNGSPIEEAIRLCRAATP